MARTSRSFVLLIGFLIGGFYPPFNAQAANVAGVELPPQLSLKGTSGALQLNGAGVRYKWFFKIYVAALYLPEPEKRVEPILRVDTPQAVTMHFLYDEVSAEKLRDAWTSGVKSNSSEEQFAALQSRLQTFNQLFTGVVSGDVVRLEFLPQQGTDVYLNGNKLGSIQGTDFSSAILKVWLGELPIDPDLKDAMLGR